MAIRGGKQHIKRTDIKVSDLKVKDILEMPEFESNFASYLSELKEARQKATESARKLGRRIKPTLIDWLDEKGYEAKELIFIFDAILNKSAVGFTARERSFIHAIGMEVYRRTLLPLIEKEKKEKKDALEKEKTE